MNVRHPTKENVARVTRRDFARRCAATALAGAPVVGLAPHVVSAAVSDAEGSLTDIGGIRVGHATDTRRPTGCTAILFDEPATAGVDYDGSAPGEMLGVALQPVSPLDRIHGILLTGGGPMGLGAVAGVVTYLESHGMGYDWGVPNVRIPLVLGAVVDDLAIGDGRIRPDPQRAARACEAASTAFAEGSVGVGAGVTVGKMFRSRGLPGMKGGVGTAAVRAGDVVVGALAVANAAGDIVDPTTGAIVAGALRADGSGFADSMALALADLARAPSARLPLDDDPFRATTLLVIGTNVNLDKTRLTKLAMMANTGAARTIRPYHTDGDGDQVIAVSTNRLRRDVSLTLVGAAAAHAASRAILRAVTQAKGIEGWRAVSDL
jgi:L-aminopeptidase/D-esterase-like protein